MSPILRVVRLNARIQTIKYRVQIMRIVENSEKKLQSIDLDCIPGFQVIFGCDGTTEYLDDRAPPSITEALLLNIYARFKLAFDSKANPADIEHTFELRVVDSDPVSDSSAASDSKKVRFKDLVIIGRRQESGKICVTMLEKARHLPSILKTREEGELLKRRVVGFTHEFRNPLTSLFLAMDLIDLPEEADLSVSAAERRLCHGTFDSCLSSMQDLLDELSKSVRFTKGELNLSKESAHLNIAVPDAAIS